MVWWRLAVLGSLGLVVACGTLLGIEPDAPPAGADAGPDAAPTDAIAPAEGGSDASAPDAAPEAGRCNLGASFGPPALIVDSTAVHGNATLSEDELTIFVDTVVTTGTSRQAIFVANRASLADSFPAGSEIMGPVAATASDNYNAALSQDGLALVFVSNRSSPGEYWLYKATRSSTASTFGIPAVLTISGGFSSIDLQPFLTSDGDLWFSSDRRLAGQLDIFRSPPLLGGGYGPPAVAAGDLTSNANEKKAVLTRDGLRVFFGSDRGMDGGAVNLDIWTATRTSKSADFGTAVRVGEVNSPSNDLPVWISPDSCRLYLSTNRLSKDQIYVASRPLN